MEDAFAFVITVGGFVLGVGSLLLRDYFRSPQGREFWNSSLLPVARLFFWMTLWMTLGCVILLLSTEIILPKLARSRESPRRHSTASNMIQLAKAMYMYADSNGMRFPAGASTSTESLWLLYPNYVCDPRNFLNPNEGLKRPTTPPQSRVSAEYLAATGFTYVEGFGPDAAAAEIVLFERVAHNGGRHVLYVAGTVEFLAELEFQALIRAQQSKRSENAAVLPASGVSSPAR